MHQSSKYQNNIEPHLAAAAKAAQYALQRVKPECKAFLDELRRFENSVNSAGIEVTPSESESVRDAKTLFITRYETLRTTLDGLAQQTSETLSKAFADIERDSDLVTIMLFGRTRAGKSTTMEALTGGDGSSIGIGKQHTTTNIRAYYFPQSLNGGAPNGPALRIVDTPGIEGFQGEALAEMAEEFVERSDHILFLLTDDKATADELDRFGAIKTQGKGVTVLLNVKASDEDLDLLISNPELIFKPDELDGHARRICGYLESHFDISPPRLIPVHARAAWLGRHDGDLPDGIDRRDLLVLNSRLHDVENRIIEFIRLEALPARLCAPRDLLLSYLLPLKDELRPFAGEFRQMMRDIERLVRRFDEGAERARVRVANQFPLLRSRFQSASDAIPGMVDSLISTSGRGQALNAQWKVILRIHGVADATTWFVSVGKKIFEMELAEEVRATTLDYEFSKADDLDDLLGEYHNADKSAKNSKYARAGIRTSGGVGAAALITWAVANWWNPTGWAAAAAAVLVGGAGIIGEAAARRATDEWEQSSKKDMYEKRGEIVGKLRDRIWADFRGVRLGCGEWLDQTKATYLNVANEVARPIQKSSQLLWQSTVECLGHLDQITNRINFELVVDIFSVNIPEISNGMIAVNSVKRSAGYRTKVIVSSLQSHHLSAVGACIGRQGTRIRQIREALGNEQIDLIDGCASKELQILQSLGRASLDQASVVFSDDENDKTVYVRFEDSSNARVAVGPRGTNVRLAKQLFGLNIIINWGEK